MTTKDDAIIETIMLTETEPDERQEARRDGRTIRAFLAEHPELVDDVGCWTRFEHLLFDVFDTEDGRPLLSYREMRERLDAAYGV